MLRAGLVKPRLWYIYATFSLSLSLFGCFVLLRSTVLLDKLIVKLLGALDLILGINLPLRFNPQILYSNPFSLGFFQSLDSLFLSILHFINWSFTLQFFLIIFICITALHQTISTFFLRLKVIWAPYFKFWVFKRRLNLLDIIFLLRGKRNWFLSCGVTFSGFLLHAWFLLIHACTGATS